jgi:PAS domain S-box-containing protein
MKTDKSTTSTTDGKGAASVSPVYKMMLWAIFPAAWFLLVLAEVISLFLGNTTLAHFLVNLGLYAVILIAVTAVSYFLSRRALLRLEGRVGEEKGRMRTILDSVPALVFYKDCENRFITANKALSDSLGMTVQELEGKSMFDIFPRDQAQAFWEDDLEVIGSGKERRDIVEPYETPGGTRWARTDKIPLRDPDGGIIGVIGFSVDITELKKTQEELEEERRFIDTAVNSLTDAFYVIAPPDGRFIRWNQRVLELTGFSEDEFSQMTVFDLFDEEGKQKQADFFGELVEKGHGTLEIPVTYKDGSTRPFEFRSTLLRDPENNPLLVVGTGRDVSERVESERAIRAAEQRYRELADSLPQAVFELDSGGVFTYVNEAGMEMFGYTREDLERGTGILQVIDPSDHENISRAVAKMMDGRSTGAVREYLARRKDGSTFPGVAYTTLIADEDGNPAGIRGIFTDISDRLEAEEARRESEERYRDLFENASDLIQSVAPDGRFIYVNRAWLEATGYTEEELEDLNLFDVIHPESLEHCMEMFQKVVAGDAVAVIEAVFKAKDGRKIYLEGSASCRFEAGEPVATRGIFTDVSYRAEAARMQRLWEQSFQNVGEGLLIVDREFNILQANPACADIVGKTAESLMGRKTYEVIHGTDSAVEACVVCKAVRNGESDEDEVFEPFLDKYLAVSADPILSRVGEVDYVVFTIRDITDRKRAERLESALGGLALKTSGSSSLANTLRMIVEAILDYTELDCGGVYLRDRESGGLDIAFSAGLSPGFLDETGHYDAGAPATKLVMGGKPVYSNYGKLDIPKSKAESDEGLRAIAVIPIVDSGEVVGCLNVASHTMDEISESSRSVIEMLVDHMSQAISRSRLAETLGESEKRYRLLTENATDVIWSADMDLKWTYLSPSHESQTGYSVEEAMSMPLYETVAPESLEQAMQLFSRAIEDERAGRNNPDQTWSLEVEQYRKDGSTIWVELKMRFIRDEGGDAVGIQGLARDVTKRKSAEEKLRRANRELDGFTRTVSHDLKGPLSAMRLASETLEDLLHRRAGEENRQDIDEVFEIMRSNVDRSSDLIDDLLAFARAGKTPEEVADVDVNKVVERILDENAGIIEEKGIDVHVDGELGRPRAHPTHIYQLFANLIRNAIKHNDSPGPRVDVSLLEEADGSHRYLVRDNGSGIPPEDMARIFEPFYKGKTGETGIGLATVDKILNENGGTMRVYNDGGACFEFVIKDIE